MSEPARPALFTLVCSLLSGCSQGAALPAASPPAGVAAYDPARDAFVVHEWGTFTSVMGSDGVLLPGLHHEEEDLPPFVTDRMKQAALDPLDPALVVGTTAKLETPVTYFYAPRPLAVRVSARFPRGFFSQWFPTVARMEPPMINVSKLPGGVELADRWLQDPGEIPAQCRPRYAGEMANGLLDWGTVNVLGRDSSPSLPAAPPAMTWGFARRTAANPVEVHAQREKFLFYRGLGRLDLPLVVRSVRTGTVLLENDDPAPLAGLVLMVVTRERAGYQVLGAIDPGGQVPVALPAADLPLPAFVEALKRELAGRLVGDGLYADEAQAMVDTWERSYFLTPGVRVLYLLPQPTTDRILPLTVDPPPAAFKRTVVIRVEALALPFEAALAEAGRQLAAPTPEVAAAGRAFFMAQGRFAEPYLTRALALVPEAATAAAPLLDEIRDHRRWAPSWAE